MDSTGPTPIQRVAAVLQAKQYLVFFAISLSALTIAAPLAVSWARDRASFADVLTRSPSAIYEVSRPGGLWLATAVAVYLLVFTWLRAGYLRSLVGRFHLRPQDGMQFLRLLTLVVVLETLAALSAWSADQGVDALTVTTGFVLLLANIALLYADYAIVISGVGPLLAARASWTCLRRNPGVSFFVVMGVLLIQTSALSFFTAAVNGGLLRSLPLLVVYVLILGVMTFVVDVTLTVVYLRTLEEAERIV